MNTDFRNLRCKVRPPIEVIGSQVGNTAQDLIGVAQLVQSSDFDPDPDIGTLGLSYVSFTTTNGVDFITALRTIELALVDGSEKLVDSTGAPRPANARQSILFAGTVATLMQTFDYFPLPRDVAGPQLQAIRWKVNGEPSALDWVIRIGVVSLLGAVR